MAKTKATKTVERVETVKVRVAVFYSAKSYYMAAGDWLERKRPKDDVLIARLASICEDVGVDMDKLPHTSLVDIELPIPEPAKPLVGKVVKVKAVKP